MRGTQLLLVAALCAAAQAIGVSSKVDLPGSASVVQRGEGLSPELVEAVLNVNVKNRNQNSHQNPQPNQHSTKINAVICVNSAAPCPSGKTSMDEGEDEEEDGNHGKGIKVDEEEEDGESTNSKQGIVFVDEDDESGGEQQGKKKKKKKIQEVPVIIGYKGVNVQDTLVNEPTRNTYELHHSREDVPVYPGLKLSPEFGKPHGIATYLQPPVKDVAVTYKHIPVGFDEGALISHIFETSPLIKALTSAYNPVVHHDHDPTFHVSTLQPREAIGGIQHTGLITDHHGQIDLSNLYPREEVLHIPRSVLQHQNDQIDFSGLHPRGGIVNIQHPSFEHHGSEVHFSTLQPTHGGVDFQHQHGPDPTLDISALHPRPTVATFNPGFIDVRTFGILKYPRPVPGFYGRYPPRQYNRGVGRPGCNPGLYTPHQTPPGVVWTPPPQIATGIKDMVDFGESEEESNDGNGDEPTVVKIDGKLGAALEGKMDTR